MIVAGYVRPREQARAQRIHVDAYIDRRPNA
jgi:hypothetical protein